MEKKLRIFALGGNDVAPTGLDPETGATINPDLPSQWKRASGTCKHLADIIKGNPEDLYIITHGNGPQVGNLMIRAEYSLPIMPPIPLDICVADTQGAMGFMLGHLKNALELRGLQKKMATIVTQVLVDGDDPDFKDPTKFVGPALTRDAAEEKKKEGAEVKVYKTNPDGEEVWRRVVGSPEPRDIIEIDIIEANLEAGIIPVAVGGGGIPVERVLPKIESGEEVYVCRHDIVYRRPYKKGTPSLPIYSGVEAVIDKDLATSLLGTMLIERYRQRGKNLSAEFTIFTDVDGAKLNFGKPDQKDLPRLNLEEAKKLDREGIFPAGSMGPKVKAAIRFVEGGGRKVYITTAAKYKETVEGKAGTTIVP
jgi:carbamate kinase